MFGLEDHKKKKKAPEFVFELENELKSAKKQQEIKKHVEASMQKIRELLRSGEGKDSFDRLGVVLHGYASLLKVMSRLVAK